MSKFIVKILVLGMVQTNCYIVHNEDTKEAIVFDPADDAERIEQYLKANDLVCKGILLTHGHFDHIMAASDLAEATNSNIYAHKEEAKLLGDSQLNVSSQVGIEIRLEPNILVQDEELLHIAGFRIKAIHTPGHTGGGVCYYFMDHDVLISGDTLFRDSIGRTDLPTGNGSLLITSILEKLMILDDDIIVYPGHGGATSIGYEKKNNYYLSDHAD